MRKNLFLLIAALLLLAYLANAQDAPFQFSHRGSILRMKFSPDGSLLLSYSSGNQDLCMWHVQSGRLVWKRPISFIQKADEYYTLNSLAWSPDQNLVATGSANGTVQLWDAGTGNFIWRSDTQRKDITTIAFSRDGKMIASASVSDKNDSVKLISVTDGTITRSLEGNPCAAIAISFDKSGEILKLGNLDGNISEWDLRSGKQLGQPAPCRELRTYDWETSFSDDLGASVRRLNGADVEIKNLGTGKTVTTTSTDSRVLSTISDNSQKAVISTSGGFRYLDLKTGAEARIDGCVSSEAFDLNSDGTVFAQECNGHNTSIKITDIVSGRSWFLDGHPGYIHAVSYSPDGKIVAVAGNDRSIYFFDPASRSLVRTLVGHGDRVTALGFSPDGKTLISGDGDGIIRTWDVLTGKSLNETSQYENNDKVAKLEFTKNGKTFLAQVNGSLTAGDASDLKPGSHFHTREGYESTSGQMTIGYSAVPINSATLSIDGTRVITGHEDGTIRIWDPDTGQQLDKFALGGRVWFVSPTPDGKEIIAVVDNKNEKTLQLVDFQKGTILRRSKKIGITYMQTFAVSPDGTYLVIAGNIGNVEMWDLKSLSLVRKLVYGLSGDDAVAFSPDSKTFFIGGDNQNLFLYDAASGKNLWQLIPSFTPGDTESKLAAEKTLRVASLVKIKTDREKQATLDVAKFQSKVYITFEHYGDMTDRGEKRIVESDELKESKSKKTAVEANSAWLKLNNDSPLPIKVPTTGMYLPNPTCFHLFSNGQKMTGLCKDREIDIWFGLTDKDGKGLPFGFDFGSSVILLPNTSVLFPVPLKILENDNSIVFSYSFQNIKASENDRDWDYGQPIELKFRARNLVK